VTRAEWWMTRLAVAIATGIISFNVYAHVKQNMYVRAELEMERRTNVALRQVIDNDTAQLAVCTGRQAYYGDDFITVYPGGWNCGQRQTWVVTGATASGWPYLSSTYEFHWECMAGPWVPFGTVHAGCMSQDPKACR